LNSSLCLVEKISLLNQGLYKDPPKRVEVASNLQVKTIFLLLGLKCSINLQEWPVLPHQILQYMVENFTTILANIGLYQPL
jgi:hypothetical protein